MEDCGMEARDMYPEAEEEDRCYGNGEGGKATEKDGEDGEVEKRSGGGGMLNNLLANLVAPMSPRASAGTTGNGDTNHRRETFQEVGEAEKGNAEATVAEEGGDEGSGGNGGGGGIIDNIVSHLPKSLPEDVAPTNDEASILIHAIVHD